MCSLEQPNVEREEAPSCRSDVPWCLGDAPRGKGPASAAGGLGPPQFKQLLTSEVTVLLPFTTSSRKSKAVRGLARLSVSLSFLFSSVRRLSSLSFGVAVP